MKYRYTESELKEAVEKSFSLAGVCRLLNMRPAGGNYFSVKQHIKKLGIDISHFTGKAWNVGIRKRATNFGCPLEQILVENSEYLSTNKLKKRLLREGYKEARCEMCGLTEWLGTPIKLELHHKNGNNTDNRIENLAILCPNCHSLTDTYRGKNIKSSILEKRKEAYEKHKIQDSVSLWFDSLQDSNI